MDNNDKRIDDIIEMLDKFTSQDGGHMNIQVNKNSDVQSKQVENANSLDCGSGNMSCKVPTLFEGLDDNLS